MKPTEINASIKQAWDEMTIVGKIFLWPFLLVTAVLLHVIFFLFVKHDA